MMDNVKKQQKNFPLRRLLSGGRKNPFRYSNCWSISDAVRAFIVFLLLYASAVATDGAIQVFTTTKTNAESISTKDIYTRDGQTNLVRTSKITSGKLQVRIQKFYYSGVHIGDYTATEYSSGFITEPGIPYSVCFEFGSSKELKSAVIGSKDGVILDTFDCTNGLLYPADAVQIQQANDLLEGTINGQQIRNSEEWVKKYKEKYKIP